MEIQKIKAETPGPILSPSISSGQACRRKAKALRTGDRLVTAEVLKEPDANGWVRLFVRKCEILSELSTRKPSPISSKTEIKRAVRTIMRGKPERLLWSDESARAVVASKFLRNR